MMSDNAILTTRDKEILAGKADPADFSDFENRKSKIRSRVRRRSDALVAEIELLSDKGEEELVDEFCETIGSEVRQLGARDLLEELDRIERELEEIDKKTSDIDRLQSEIEDLREKFEQRD